MTVPSQLPDLHDATLVSVRFDWASGVTTLVFRTSAPPELRVVVSECTELVVPRHEEWGRSVSVLSASCIDGDPERGVVVEMQSGDRLVVRGCVQEPALVRRS